jgi:carbonic anhydrase
VKKKHTLAIALSLCGSLAQASGGTHWGYTGHEGPEHWGELDPAYALCATGKNQSPVDIVDSVEAELAPLEIAYSGKATEILNNGHTVQANFPAGSFLTVSGHRFELKQVHFHTPSENHIGGQAFPLEAHFVHADADGNLAVIGVMFKEGAENGALTKLWSEMPMHGGERHTLATSLEASELLPNDLDYYRFNGSLTTPPCSEGVWWQVMKNPLSISKAQVEKFSHAVHGHNNRQIQARNARPLLK